MHTISAQLVSISHKTALGMKKTHLSRTRMQEPNVLRREHTHQLSVLREPDLDKVLLERQNVLVTPSGKCCRLALPGNLPVVARSPTVLVNEERKVGVAEQKLGWCTFYVNRLDVVATDNKVQGCVGLVEQRLRFQCFERYNFESASAANAQFAPQEVDAVGFHRNVEFLLDVNCCVILRHNHRLTLYGFKASCPPANILDNPDFFLPLVIESIGSYTLTVLDSDDDLTQQTSNLPLHIPALK